MNAANIMIRDVITVGTDVEIEELCEIMQIHNIKGVPVVDDEDRLIGIVTQDDLVYGQMGLRENVKESREIGQLVRSVSTVGDRDEDGPRLVGEIMTSPAISAEEGTPVEDLCRTMWTLRIHRIPILKGGKVTGIVSSMDLCKAIAEGTIQVG